MSSIPKHRTHAGPPDHGLSPQKKRLFAILAMLFAPVFFVCVEIGLRLAHYGSEYDLVTTSSRFGKQYNVINPVVGKRYFSSQEYFLPQIASGTFEIVKPAGTVRVFVLGESTTAGFPYEYSATPSSMLRKQLEWMWPEKKFEIINVGLTATNSYTVLEFIDDLTDYKPDAFIIYSGQNEFYGALGMASTVSLGKERWLIRTYQTLWNLKTFILLHDALRGASSWLFGARKGTPDATLMEQMAKDKAIPFQSELYVKARDAFEQNLRACVSVAQRYNIPIVISTLVTNEGSLEPFVSLHQESTSGAQKAVFSSLLQAGDSLFERKEYAAAVGVYGRAILADSMWAGAEFRLGRAYDALGEFDSARIAYARARDLDGLRFRAGSDFNILIRRLCGLPGVTIADVDSAFRANSPEGIIGKELMWEHVHPNLQGYKLLSQSWLDALIRSKMFSSDRHSRPGYPLADSLFVASLGITPLDLEIGKATMSVLLQRWPFTASNRLAAAGLPDAVQSVAQLFLRGNLRWNEAHYEMADSFLVRNDLARAVKEFEAVNAGFPDDPFPLMRMGDLYSILCHDREAEGAYRQLLSLGENPVVRLKLGVTYLKLERAQAAVEQLSTALSLNDRSRVQLTREQYEETNFFLALALDKSGKTGEALQVLSTLLRMDPGNARAVRLARELRNRQKK
jgi:tetratricopeptide (TPR) repeat protein